VGVDEMFGTALPSRIALDRLIDEKTWVVRRPFDVHLEGRAYTVPAGFPTDLDSVPRLPLMWLFFKGHAVVSAAFHDWLYASGVVPRAEADRLFWLLLRIEGAGRITSAGIWTGVRVGGWNAWRRHRRGLKANIAPGHGGVFTRERTDDAGTSAPGQADLGRPPVAHPALPDRPGRARRAGDGNQTQG
jgi:hypothetical protein